MHENEISHLILGAAMEVQRHFGPGLVEQVYEEALCHEFRLRSMPFKRQQAVPILDKGVRLGPDLRLNLLVHDKVIVDNKAKEAILPFDKVKMLTDLRLTALRLGLIINYHHLTLKDGVIRLVNGLDESSPLPRDFRR